MSLTSWEATAIAVSFPRVSGDEPDASGRPLFAEAFSPRERG